MKLATNEITFLREKLRLAKIHQRSGLEPFVAADAERVADLTRRLGLARSIARAKRAAAYLPGFTL